MTTTYVAVGENNTLLTSTDCISWQAQTSGLASLTYFYSAFSGSDKLLVGGRKEATAYDTTLITSANGSSWASHAPSWTQTQVLSGVYTGSLYVVTGSGGKIASSNDGLSWTDRANPFNAGTICGVAWGNSVLVAVSQWPEVGTSTDGTTWTIRTMPSGWSVANGVAFGNSVFVMVGNGGKIATSTNGQAWTNRTSGTTYTIYGVCYGDSGFVAVGGNSTTSVTLLSTDGITWNAQTNAMGANTPKAVTFANGLYVIVGNNGAIVTSSNGTSWSSQTSGTTQHLLAVAGYTPAVVNVDGVGSSSGTSTATGVGVSLAASAGSSSGAATVEAIGTSFSTIGAGSSSGSSTVSGVGGSIVSAVGSSSGSATASGKPPLGPYDVWEDAFQSVFYGANDARILCIGDSITEGIGTFEGDDDVHSLSWPTKLMQLLSSHVDVSNDAVVGFSAFASCSYDPRVIKGTGWTHLANFESDCTLGGATLDASGTVSDTTFTPTNNFNTFRVYFVRGNGVLSIGIDNNSPVLVDTNGTSGVGYYEASTTLGNHTIKVNRSSGSVRLAGFETWDTTTKRVIVCNAGFSGTTAYVVNGAGTDYAWSGKNSISLWRPDLVFIMLGTNNMLTASPSEANATAMYNNLSAIVAAAKNVASVVLCTPPPTCNDSDVGVNVSLYLNKIRALATDLNVPLLDVYNRWGAYTNHLTWYGNPAWNEYANIPYQIHPNADGYNDIAAAAYAQINETLSIDVESVGSSYGTSSVSGSGSSLAAVTGSSSGLSTVIGRSNIPNNTPSNLLLLLN